MFWIVLSVISLMMANLLFGLERKYINDIKGILSFFAIIFMIFISGFLCSALQSYHILIEKNIDSPLFRWIYNFCFGILPKKLHNKDNLIYAFIIFSYFGVSLFSAYIVLERKKKIEDSRAITISAYIFTIIGSIAALIPLVF